MNRTVGGYTAPSDASNQIFTSFMKARIFCEREMPPGTQFVGAQDFKYDEMCKLHVTVTLHLVLHQS